MGFDWTKILAIAGGATAATALLWYLTREEQGQTSGSRGTKSAKRPDDMGQKDVIQILDEIIASQEKMSTLMKQMAQTILDEKLVFRQVYERVLLTQPKDPLDQRGLSMMDFDQLLDTHQHDSEVKEKIGLIMSAGSAKATNVKPAPLTEIAMVHEYMCTEIKKLVTEFQGWNDSRTVDRKVLTIAAQALVASRVQKNYGYSSDQIEACVVANSSTLGQDPQFTALNVQMQQAMGMLMG